MMIEPDIRMWIAGGAAAAVSALAILGLAIWPQDLNAAGRAPAKSGAAFTDCQGCPEMVILPAGSYMMGTPLSIADSRTEQPPQHITLRPFAISRYEITQKEWSACVAAKACAPLSVPFAGDKLPAVNMTFGEARRYAGWLSKTTGHIYRLPSEAEWEYAAGGVTTAAAPHTLYWWGNEESVCEAGARNGANTVYCDTGRAYPVGTFAANPFGLFDVAGNVWEWTQDCYRDNLVGQPADGAAVLTGDCTQRVVRGGSWVARPDISETTDRSHAEDRDTGIGIRLVRELPAG